MSIENEIVAFATKKITQLRKSTKKPSTDSKSQYEFWQEIYICEEIVKYFNNTKNKPSEHLTDKSTNHQPLKLRVNKSKRPETLELEKTICSIVQQHPTGIQAKDLKEKTEVKLNKTISEATFANRLTKMCNYGTQITRAQRGFYVPA